MYGLIIILLSLYHAYHYTIIFLSCRSELVEFKIGVRAYTKDSVAQEVWLILMYSFNFCKVQNVWIFIKGNILFSIWNISRKPFLPLGLYRRTVVIWVEHNNLPKLLRCHNKCNKNDNKCDIKSSIWMIVFKIDKWWPEHPITQDVCRDCTILWTDYRPGRLSTWRQVTFNDLGFYVCNKI